MNVPDANSVTAISLAAIFLIWPAMEDLKFQSFALRPVLILGTVCLGLRLLAAAAGWTAMPDPVLMLTGPVPGLLMMLLGRQSQGKVGLGDGLALAVMGLLTGLSEAVVILLIALTLCSLTGLILILGRRAHRGTALPFLPYLEAGCLIELVSCLYQGQR